MSWRFKAIDRYILPNVWKELFPLLNEQAARLNDSFRILLRDANLGAFEEEKERLSREYTDRICRVFDISGAVPEGYACAGYIPQ